MKRFLATALVFTSIILASHKPALANCQAGSSVDISSPTSTRVELRFASGHVIPASSAIFLISKQCQQGQRSVYGQAPNFWLYVFRWRGLLFVSPAY